MRLEGVIVSSGLKFLDEYPLDEFEDSLELSNNLGSGDSERVLDLNDAKT